MATALLALVAMSVVEHPEPTDMACLNAGFPGSMTDHSYIWTFSGGETGTTIADGGNDMYDNGNELRVRVRGQWSDVLKYTNICDGDFQEPTYRGDVGYATCKYTSTGNVFTMIVHSDSGSIDGFRVSGNLGADGGGSQSTSPQPLVGPNGTFGFYKSVHGATQGSSTSRADPSINHLVIARSTGQHTIGVDTDSDEDMIVFDTPVNHVIYLLWAGYNGHEFSEASFQAALTSVATSCFSHVNVVLPRDVYSPPPPPVGHCVSRPCGPDATCADFVNTPCTVVEHRKQQLEANGMPGQCDCNGGCCNLNAQPSPPPPPPPAPRRPAPAPMSCSASCAGSTCGAFAPYSCDDFKNILGCDCAGCCKTTLDLTCVDKIWPAPDGENDLPNLYAFTEGTSGRRIIDGGSDMFDGGNYLSLNIDGQWSFELPYTQDCHGLFPQEVGTTNVHYSTCKLVDGGISQYYADYRGDITSGTLFSASFHSEDAKIKGFLVSGNLGADGGGSFEDFHLEGPRGVHAYYKQVYGAQHDPSISHLILTRAAPSQLANNAPTLSYNTDSDFHEIMFQTGQTAVIYMLWAGKLPTSIPGLDYSLSYRFTKSEVQRVVDAVSESCFSALAPASQPPSPPPPPPYPPLSADCERPCGAHGTTCSTFRHTQCSLLRQPPWSCNCGACCTNHAESPPPPKPPRPPSSPPPSVPSSGACNKECAGATCGAFSPYSCDAFELLGCDCSGCCTSPLDAHCVDEVWPANLPALYNFGSGTTSYYIGDGGRDAYDVGNEIRVRVNGQWSSPLYYNQICDGSHSHPVGNSLASLGDANYITCKLPLAGVEYYNPGFGAAFVFIVTSKAGDIDGFMTLGNLGADKGGEQYATTSRNALSAPDGVTGYYKQTFGADAAGVSLSDPSINHLIFGKGLDGADVTIGSTTDSDLHELHFKNGVSQLYYVLFMGKEGYEYPRAAFQEALNQLAGSCDLAAAHARRGGGGGGGGDSPAGAIVGVIFGLLALGGIGYYLKTSGTLEKLFAAKAPRARTNPAGGGNPMSTAPLSTTSTARAGLAGNDSAAEGFATAYIAPTPS